MADSSTAARLRRRRRSPRSRDRRDRRHRAPADRGHRGQRVSQSRRTPAAATVIQLDCRDPLRCRLRGAARPLGCLPRRGPARGRRCCCCRSGPLAEHNIRDHVRGKPAGLRRYRGGQPRDRRRRRRRASGRPARARPSVAVHLRYRRPLRRRGGRRGRGGARRRASTGSIWPDRRRRWRMRPSERPDDYLTAKIDAVEALSNLLTRLGA